MANLIGNAIKYMVTPGDIIIQISEHARMLTFSVRDDGVGIPEEDIGNIFLRYFRVSGSASLF